MSVTVMNGTNWLINTSLSAAVNYDWRNAVQPKQYVVMHKGLVDTLNVRWYDGETSLYDNSGAEIGLFVAGTLIGIVATAGGIIAVLVTGGAGIPILIGVGVTYLGAGGVAIGGIGYAAHDFKKTPANWTNITVAHNRIFMVKGERTATEVINGVPQLKVTEALSINEISPDEFSRLTQKEGWAESRDDQQETTPVESTYYSGTKKALDGYQTTGESLTAAEIVDLDFLGGTVWIYPSYSGVPDVSPACWTGGDHDGHELQMFNDKRQTSQWMIIPVDKHDLEPKAYNPRTVDPQKVNFGIQAYNIYNPATDMYACVGNDEGDPAIRIKKHPEPNSAAAKRHQNTDRRSLFFIIKSLNCYAFVPISRQTREVDKAIRLPAVINQGGETGNGTPVVVGDRTGPHPGWARWVVERCSLQATPGLVQRQIEELSVNSPLGEKLIDRPVRIFPAIARRHPLGADELPVCWDVDLDPNKENKPIQLWGRDAANVQWVIKKRAYTGLDAFSFYCPAFNQYAKVSQDGYLETTNGSSPAEFMIKYSMGFFSFFALGEGKRGDVWVERFENGARLRVGDLPPKEPSRNRWQIISTDSVLAKLEKWKA